MKKNLYILVILTLVLFGGCNLIPQKEENKTWNAIRESNKIEDLISFAFNYPKAEKRDSCIIKLDQLVRVNPEIRLAVIPLLDTIKGEIKFSTVDTNDDCLDYCIKKRNAYLITIKEDGVFDDERKLSYLNLKDSISKLLTNPYPNYKGPERKVSDVKYFGTILTSKLTIILDTNIEEFRKNTNINWELYFEAFAMVKLVYFEIWNEKAQEVWNKDYSSLDFDKKLAIMKCLPFYMELNFLKRT